MDWKCKLHGKGKNKYPLVFIRMLYRRFWNYFLFSKYSTLLGDFEIMGLAIVNGLLTSIILETIILIRQMNLKQAINTALGMSFISMIGMELAMNITGYFSPVEQFLIG